MYGAVLGCRVRTVVIGLFLFGWVTGSVGQQTRANGAGSGMVGWAPEELANLQSGELTVWESGSGVRLGWAAIQNALKADFPGLQVNFRVVDPDEFLGDLAAAKQNGTLPDVVFVENWRQGGPLLAQQRVVEMMGQTRFWSAGWWFQMLGGAHQGAATAFLRWLEDSPHWRAPRMSSEGMTEADRQQVTSAALLAVAGIAGGGSTDSVMDADAAKVLRYGISWGGTVCGTISRMSFPVTRFAFGNGRLAYAAVAAEARSSGGSVECSGVVYTFLVLRKRQGAWKVLLATPRVPLELALSRARDLDQLHLEATEGSTPDAPELLSPFDGEQQTRDPKEYLSWRQVVPRPVAYAVEWRYGMPRGGEESYGPAQISIFAAIDYGDVVRIPMPFGIGAQPHRWRVWAIGRDGQVALSEWRTVNFTN